MRKFITIVFAVLFGLIGMGYFFAIYEQSLGIEEIDIPICLPDTDGYVETFYEILGEDIGGLFFGIVFFLLSFYFFSLNHKLKKKKKGCKTQDVKGPFILYLRSFVADKQTKKMVSFSTLHSEEEALVEVMSELAPVYAIGDPKDKEMPLGASRIYVSDDKWKSIVEDMSRRAIIVILRLGETDSFWWEVDTILKTVPLEKVLFIVPSNRKFNEVSRLYKKLLDNNIDIGNLGVTVDKKKRGSISSFLFFKEHEPKVVDIYIPRFTRIFLSYENIIRKALSDFRDDFHLSKFKFSIKKIRVFQILLVTSLLFMSILNFYNDYTRLKNQTIPYELLEYCVTDTVFTQYYSADINDTNLSYCIVESFIGAFALDGEDYISKFCIETITLDAMSIDEYKHMTDHVQNMLLMVKKYCPKYYNDYISILYKAAMESIKDHKKMNSLVEKYKLGVDTLPKWVYDISNKYEKDVDEIGEFKALQEYNSSILRHINDENISTILKILDASQL